MQKVKSIDKFFLGIVLSLVLLGFISFVSASLGVLAKNEQLFYSLLFSQIILGLFGGICLMFLFSNINYKIWRKYSFWIFVFTLILTILVFIPGIGIYHGGAKRWISILGISFQPVEALKIGFILYLSGWLSWIKAKYKNIDFKMGILPVLILLGLISFILLNQPDTKNIFLLGLTSLVLLFISGAKLKHLSLIIGVGLLAMFILIFTRPYIMDRFETYLNNQKDPLNSSWQLRQSYIAIGSGGFFGRGLGQSIQKFSFLPEPQGDSIFAVIGEEFGFMGSTILIILFSAFCLRGLKIASNAPDIFSRLLVSGIVIIMTAQSFLNIGANIGIFPLTGVPLVFVSHGGTALFMSLASIGIVLNISRYQKIYNKN